MDEKERISKYNKEYYIKHNERIKAVAERYRRLKGIEERPNKYILNNKKNII